MKVNNNLFICALLVLMLFLCISAASAEETLDTELASEEASDIVAIEVDDNLTSDSSSEVLGDGNTLIVGDGGDYTSISAAVSAATGGDTIFIKNGEYTESKRIQIGNKQLNFVGESQEGVILKSTATANSDTGFFYTTTSGYTSLTFNNLTFVDINGGNIGTIQVGGDGTVEIKDCTFDGCKSKYGAFRVFTSGTATIENCKVLNTKTTTTSGSSAIDLAGSGTANYTLKNVIIDGASASNNNFGVLYHESTTHALNVENLTIINSNGNVLGVVYSKGNINIKNSKFENNSFTRDGAGIFYCGGNNKEITVESSMIVSNSAFYFLTANTASTINLNYNNIQNNSNITAVVGSASTAPTSILEANYWGSNELPANVTASTWVVENNGVYTLNNGDPLEKTIPGLTDGGEEPSTLPEGTIYISETGNDTKDGLSEANAIATLAHAVEIVQARENKTATVYMLNGDYTTGAIDIGDSNAVNLTIIGQEKGKVVIHGTGAYIFDVYGDNLVWKFENLNIVDVSSTARTSAGLVLYGTNSNFTVDNCIFNDINTKLGAIALGNEKGIINVTNCIVENITGSASNTAVITVNGDSVFNLDNFVIRNCRLNDEVASGTTSSYLRSLFYVNTYDATVTISNSEITDNYGPMMSLFESRAKLTIIDTTIANNVVNTSLSGANGGDNLIWASNDASIVNIANCVITNNTVVKSGKGLFYNQRGSINVEYSDLSGNDVDKFVGSTGTITADNNWWGTNDQPDSKISKWVIMNVELNDTDLAEHNKITLTIDFNHVNTTSGIEELTGGEIPKDSYKVDVAAQNGEITPASVVVNKGATKTETFTVTEINDVITLTCDGDAVPIVLEGIPPYRGIIYVNTTGNDTNNGSIEAPVASIAKAIELAEKGSGQIVISEGVYVGNTYTVTKNLNITGVGNVVLDADGQGGLFYIPSGNGVSLFYLSNVKLVGANSNYHQAVRSYASELILDNVKITNNPGSGSLIGSNGKLTMDNCVIANHNGGNVLECSGNGDIIINNTIFENNTVTDYAIVYSSSYSSKSAIIENTIFRNNTGKLGIAKINKKTTVKNSKFIDNTNTNSYGGAISDCDSLNVTDSIFINNKAARAGGAINLGYNRQATITHSTFINNTANTANGGDNGDAIYSSGKLTVNYCVLLTNAENSLIYSESSDDVDAQFNWWGTNDDPSSLNGVKSGSVINSSNWVVMNITTNMTADAVDIGEMVELTVDFTNYNATDSLKPLAESIPEVTVTANAVKGALNATEEITSGNIAKFTYVPAEPGVNTIDFTSAKPAVQFNITVNEPVVIEIIYVSATGNDTNNGSTEDNAVATIAHAIELANAAKGKIIILSSETPYLCSMVDIAKDLDITGRGNVVLDGNLAYILDNAENVNLNLTNLKFTNAKSANSAAIRNYGNVLIENCTFYNCNTTGATSAGPINNMAGGTMTINNSKFYNNRGGRGIVASQAGSKLIINNSELYDNDCTGYSSNSMGIVYGTSADLIVENTVIRNNKVGGSGAGIYVTRSTSATTGSLTANNLTIKNNIASAGTGGAVFISGTRTAVTINNSKFINNTAIGTTSTTGLGGAIYLGTGTPEVTITQSVFIDNSGVQGDAGIYVKVGTFDISDSIILAKDGDTNYALNKQGGTVTAENNWWGSNDKANTNANVDKIVKMNATLTPETAQGGDAVTITATFDNDKLPDGFIEVAFTSSTGSLDKTATVKNGAASVSYDGDVDDLSISVKSSEAEVLFEFDPEAIMIFVSPSGNDTNPGTRASPVATLEKALELASKGKIVLLEGTYKTGDLGYITKDLSIAGEGNAVIDANNNNAILYVGGDAKVVISNVTMINGYSADISGGLLANTNELTLINCTLANSSSAKNGGAIFNSGKLTIINTTFANCDAKQGGAIYSQSGIDDAAITISNSVFKSNVARGSDRFGGGAIYAQRTTGFYTLDLTIENTTFENNRAEGTSCGGAIALEQLNFNAKITDSEFIANHANGQSAASGSNGLLAANDQAAAGGGAIYASSAEIYTNGGTMDITGTLFENNTADANGGAIYAKTTTVNVANSVLVNNLDANGVAVYGEKTEQASPVITLNDNWWGSNDDPSDLIGGNGYAPSLSRWAILTITNDTQIAPGETVGFTVSINNYTTGTANGTMSKPITVKRNVVLSLNKDEIPLTLENGVATYSYTVPADTKFIAASVDGETQVLFVISSPVTVEIDSIEAKKYEKVHVEINVTSDDVVDAGSIELYVDGDKLIATIDVIGGKAVDDLLISEDDGIYNLTAKYVSGSPLFEDNQTDATLTVSGIVELVNATFFNYFDDAGILRDEITEDELVFHGDFGGLGVTNVIINRPVRITGDNAKLNDLAVSIFSSDVSLDNLTLNATSSVGDLIGVYESNVNITNMNIYYSVGNEDAVAINVLGASDVIISGNDIYFESHVIKEPSRAIAINVEGASDVIIDGNDIKASFTTVDSNWALYYKYGMMGVDTVSTIRVDSSDDVAITDNEIDTSLNALQGSNPTAQSVIILGSSDVLFDGNNLTMIDDVTPKGNESYLYGLVLGFVDGIISNNNFDMATEGGADTKGSAYPINIVTSDLEIFKNNISSVSNGPNIGIYVSFSYDYDHMLDEFEVNIEENAIDITGFSSSKSTSALVTGIETAAGTVTITENNISVANKAGYVEGAPVHGVSYVQSAWKPEIDIENNIILDMDGDYAISINFGNGVETTAIYNVLYAHELCGDAAVYVKDIEESEIRDNYPVVCDNITVAATDVFEGQNTTITVSVPGCVGTVTIRVNGKVVGEVELEDGIATFETNEYGNNYTVNATFNGDLTHLPNSNTTTFNLIGNVVTNETFYTYFDESGILRDEVSYDELIFQGEFSNLGAGYVIIAKPIRIIGDDAVLTDLGISVSSSDVALDNLTLTATTSLVDLVGVYESNVNITNLDIYYAVGDEDAVAINVVGASNVIIKDNSIYLESHVTSEPSQAIAINVEGSSDVVIDSNDVESSFTTVDSDWTLYTKYGMMGIDSVSTIRVDSSDAVAITDNEIDTSLNALQGSNPTVQSVIILGSSDVLFDSNDVTLFDTVTAEGQVSYLYGLVLGFVDGTISNNNIAMATNGGGNAKGSAYPVNIVTSNLDINKNNISSVSNGPNIGIYVGMSYDYEHMMDDFDIVIKENNIDIEGFATSKGSTALISGIEAGAGAVTISKNNISVSNKVGYVEGAPVHGVSYVQSAWIPELDIQDNNIFDEDGDYAISVNFGRGVETTAVNNYIVAHEFYGDAAVYVKDMDESEIEDNRPYDPELTINVENITVGEDAIINIATDNGATGVVSVIVDGNIYTVDVSEGKANITVSGLKASDYTVTATFASADIDYGDSKNGTVFNVAKMESDMNITVSEAQLGENATITVSIPEATGKVTVIVNGKEEEIELDENGNASYTIENITAGDYYVTAIYSGDNDHAAAYRAANFTIDKLESEIALDVNSTKVGEETTISVNVTEGATGIVIIDVNGTEYSIDLAESNSIAVTFDNAGKYPVIATYLGDDTYAESKSGQDVIVVSDKQAANIRIEIPENIKVGDEITINITADSDAALTVTINGEVQDFIPANGPLSVSLMDVLKATAGKVVYDVDHAGIYNITVSAGENDEFAAETVTEIFEVTKKDAVLEIVPITDAKAHDVITISVVNETDGEITVKVNGEEVSGEYFIPKAGKYTITAESAATDSYNAGFATYTFDAAEDVVAKLNTNISLDINVVENSVAFTVDVDKLASGIVKFEITGAEEDTLYVDVIDGKATLEGVLGAGEYSVIATYMGDDLFNTNITKDSFTVIGHVKQDTPIDASVDIIGYRVTVTVTVDSNATGFVAMKLGDTVANIALTDGTGSFTTTLAAGSYSADLTYLGDYNFNENETSLTFTVADVAKENTTIAVDITSDDNNASFTVYVNPNATGIVKFEVTGPEHYELYVAVVDGEAFLYDILQPGDYTLVVTYMGDDRFNTNITSEKFTITDHVKQDTAVEASADVNGYRVTVNVAVDLNATGFVSMKLGDDIVIIPLTDGAGSFTTTLPAGSYNVELTYLGDDEFNENTTSLEFTVVDVSKENTPISVDISSFDSDVSFICHVNPEATGIVKFEVTGPENYVLYVDVVDGDAFLYNVLQPGDYTLVATYIGDARFNTNITSEKFTIKEHEKQDTPIKATVDVKGYRITVNVEVDSDATGFVAMKLGSTVAYIALSDGVGSYSATLSAGSYYAEFVYLGDDEFNENATDLTFTVVDVAKENTPISIDISSVDTNASFTVHVNPEATGIIKMEVTGPEHYLLYVDVINGEGFLYDILQPGDYTIVVTYMGDDRFNTNITSEKFTITDHVKQDTAVEASADVNGYRVTVNVAVDSNATGFVSMKLGDDIVIIPLTDGAGSFTTTLPAGSYNVELTYLGDDEFNENSTSLSFTVVDVSKENTTIEIDVASFENDASFIAHVNPNATGIVKFEVTGPENYVLYVDVVDGEAFLYSTLQSGDYNVVVTYMGDDRFNTNITSEEFTIKGHVKQDTPIDASVTINGYRVTVTVNVDSAATGFVNMKLGESIVNVALIDGTGSVTATLAAGSYYTDITYLGDENFNENKTSLSFTVIDVTKENTTIGLDVSSVDDNASFTVYVNPNATGIVKFEVTGPEHYVLYVDVIDGESFLYDRLQPGNYTIVVTYMGDSRYNTNITSKDFTINNTEKQDTNISVTVPDIIKLGEYIPIAVDIPGATGDVSVIVDGVEKVVPLDENGTAKYTIPALDAGDHSIVVVYPGDETHNGGFVSKAISVTAVASEFVNITVSGDGVVTAKLVDETGAPIKNAQLTYTINGKAYTATTDANGIVVVNASSNSVVDIRYAGNDKVLPANVTITLKDLAPARIATEIISSPYVTYAIDFYEGERGHYFNVQLVDQKGNPLANKPVKIGFNGVVYDSTTNATGWAKLQINLISAGLYTFAVGYLGDDEYNASFIVQKITVNKKKTTISASAKSYKASAKTKSYTVTLKTVPGSSIDGKAHLQSGKKITMKLNGKTYTAKTNSKGQVTFKLKLTKKGKFAAAIKFAGDSTYLASSKSVKITIK